MAEPTAPDHPDPIEPDALAQELEPEADPEGEEDAPLNRAARRSRGKQGLPGHVGPQPGRSEHGRGARSHTKRRSS